nr:hypothetical protein [Cupriavidus lacunae]
MVMVMVMVMVMTVMVMFVIVAAMPVDGAIVRLRGVIGRKSVFR